MAGLLAINATEPDVPGLAAQALRLELDLTPKPGLVDRANNGSHQDMDHALLLASIAAITPWLRVFTSIGFAHAQQPAAEQLPLLRPAGIASEQAMFTATGGVNTHKGGIFSLGLLCFAAGRLQGQGQGRRVSADTLCRQVSDICHGLVARERVNRKNCCTAGERQLQHALLRLMASNPDSNLLSRGGRAGLRYVQRYAASLLATGWDNAALRQMDQALMARRLSPGGSADLLAVAWVLAALA